MASKQQTEFSPEDLAAKLKELQDFQNNMPNANSLQEMMGMAKNALKTTVAKESKTIKIGGIECVAFLYEDSVKVQFPAQDMIRKFYDNLK